MIAVKFIKQLIIKYEIRIDQMKCSCAWINIYIYLVKESTETVISRIVGGLI